MENDARDDSSARLIYRNAPPSDLVSSFPAVDGVAAVVVTPTSPALVLGSTQPIEGVDETAADAAGLPRVRRRSGGGGVVVRPGSQLWVDVFIPAGHPSAHHDVAKAALIAGELWAGALRPLVREVIAIHDGPLIETPWSRFDCFSGLGPGEVLLGGRKLVGVSQRRTRAGTWLFTQAHVRFDPAEHASLFTLDRAGRSALEHQLGETVVTLPIAASIAERALVAAVEALPD